MLLVLLLGDELVVLFLSVFFPPSSFIAKILFIELVITNNYTTITEKANMNNPFLIVLVILHINKI